MECDLNHNKSNFKKLNIEINLSKEESSILDADEAVGVELARAHWMQLHKLNLQVFFFFLHNLYIIF